MKVNILVQVKGERQKRRGRHIFRRPPLSPLSVNLLLLLPPSVQKTPNCHIIWARVLPSSPHEQVIDTLVNLLVIGCVSR